MNQRHRLGICLCPGRLSSLQGSRTAAPRLPGLLPRSCCRFPGGTRRVLAGPPRWPSSPLGYALCLTMLFCSAPCSEMGTISLSPRSGLFLAVSSCFCLSQLVHSMGQGQGQCDMALGGQPGTRPRRADTHIFSTQRGEDVGCSERLLLGAAVPASGMVLVSVREGWAAG